MAQRPLTFGALLSDLLSNTNLNFQDLYSAVSAIQENLADGSNKAVVYPSIEAMVTGLNSNKMADGTTQLNLAIGDDILIIAEGVPDFWISAKNTSPNTGAAPDTWEVGKKYTFGYYEIVGFESGTSLVGYQTVDNMQGSINANDAYNNTKYPSVQAIIDYVESLGFAANGDLTSYLTKTDASRDYLSKTDASNTYLSKTDASSNYATKEELEDAGKVKGVSVNGYEVALDANGIAPITIDDIESGFTECTTFEQITVNDTTYYAIKVEETAPALEVYNSSKQQIMTQTVVQNGYMYYCIGTSNPSENAYYLRQLNGSTVNVNSGSGSVDLSNYYTKSEVDSKISGSGGGSGVTVSSITAGNPTDVTVNETSYTSTPVTFKYSNGSSQTIDVKAKNGSGHELSFETVSLTLNDVTVPMETVTSLNGYKAVYMVEGAELSLLTTTIENTLELRILVSITNPNTESLMTLGSFVLYPNSAGVGEGFGVIRGLSEGNTTYNIGTCYYNNNLSPSCLYFCEPEEPNNGYINGEWPSSDNNNWSVTGPDGTEYTTTNCEFKIGITRVKFS